MPLLIDDAGARRTADDDAAGPALGLDAPGDWPPAEVRLDGRWSLLLYTDGLVEGRVGDDRFSGWSG